MATREGLYEALDRFRDALAARDACARRVVAEPALHREQRALEPGDGVWNTLTALGPYDLRFADASHGQVALFTSVEETDAVSPCAIRLAFRDGVVEECEIVVARNKDEGFPFLGQKFEDKPAMLAEVPEAERISRAEMIALANGYFETIERNNGMIRTRFHPHCNRVENGVQTTNNPEFPLPIAQPRLRGAVRARLVPLRRRAARAAATRWSTSSAGSSSRYGFIDHSGKLGDYELTDGTKVSSLVRRPHSYYLAEAFKIRDAAIEQVEAVFHTVPYRMPSPVGAGDR